MKSSPVNQHKTIQVQRNIRDRRLMLKRKKDEQQKKLEGRSWVLKHSL